MYFSTSLVLGEVVGPFPEIESWKAESKESPLRGGVPLTVGVDFAAPFLVHVGKVEWVKVSRYM